MTAPATARAPAFTRAKPTRRAPAGPMPADLARAAAARRIVLHHVADLVECDTLEAAAAVVCELYAALYTVAAADWLGSASPARDLAEAIYDARAMVPALITRYLAQTLSEWAAADRDTDYQTSLVPGYVRQYLEQVIDLLNHRLGIAPAPAVALWATPWLLRLDGTAIRSALGYVGEWTPPPKARRSVVDSAEHRDRSQLWADWVACSFDEVTRSGKTYSKARREQVPTSQSYFAGRHNLNASEVSRWRSGRSTIAPGSAPDTCIRRTLKEDLERMRGKRPPARP